MRCVTLALAVGLTLACGTGQSAPDIPHDFRGVVVAASPGAAEAGAHILALGGNAIDAAVAVSFALGVTEPAMSGIGGQSQILLHAPGEAPIVINGTSYSPRGTPINASAADVEGHRATTIPTTVRVMEYAWTHHGSGNVAWSDLLASAIRFAEEGFTVGPFRHKVWTRHRDQLRADTVVARLFLDEDGDVPREGTVWRQPVLARTLRRLADQGAADFYSGEIAQAIAADMEASGGWIRLDDLAELPPPFERAPLHESYRGWDVYTLPPPGGGWVVLQILNLLGQSAAAALHPDSASRTALVAQALDIAHGNRRSDPVTNLREYDADVRDRISKDAARQMFLRENRGSGETTHFSIVDADGMAVSVTASINAYFGARAATASLGFLYNSYMDEYVVGFPEHPFALRPDAMPYSSMSPTILARDSRPVLVLGSPGSARIISAVAQVVQLWTDGGLSIVDAVAAPRLHVQPEKRFYYEALHVPRRIRRQAESSGYSVESVAWDLSIAGLNAYFGGVHAVALEDTIWIGAADPRRDGAVAFAR